MKPKEDLLPDRNPWVNKNHENMMKLKGWFPDFPPLENTQELSAAQERELMGEPFIPMLQRLTVQRAWASLLQFHEHLVKDRPDWVVLGCVEKDQIMNEWRESTS